MKKRCKIPVLWTLIVLELYVLILIASYIWMNLVIRVSGERLVSWNFPSPFYLWSTPIYTWGGLAYLLTLAVFAGIVAAVTYREISVCRS